MVHQRATAVQPLSFACKSWEKEENQKEHQRWSYKGNQTEDPLNPSNIPNMKLKFNKPSWFCLAVFLAGSLLAAGASPREDVLAAAAALGSQTNYS